MSEPTTSRRLRVLVFASAEGATTELLKRILLHNGCFVRTCTNIVEFLNIIKIPTADFGLVIVLSPVSEKIFSKLRSDKRILVEYGPGRCNLTALAESVASIAKNYGRY